MRESGIKAVFSTLGVIFRLLHSLCNLSSCFLSLSMPCQASQVRVSTCSSIAHGRCQLVVPSSATPKVWQNPTINHFSTEQARGELLAVLKPNLNCSSRINHICVTWASKHCIGRLAKGGTCERGENAGGGAVQIRL